MAPFHHLYLLMATCQLKNVILHFTVSPFSLAGIVCAYRFYVSFSSISPSLYSHGCSIAPQVSISSSLYSFFLHSAVRYHLNVYQRSISLPLFSHTSISCFFINVLNLFFKQVMVMSEEMEVEMWQVVISLRVKRRLPYASRAR